MSRPVQVDVTPLRLLMDRRGWSDGDVANRTGFCREQVLRWRHRGSLPWFAADVVACRLGYQVDELFPDFPDFHPWWNDVEDQDERRTA